MKSAVIQLTLTLLSLLLVTQCYARCLHSAAEYTPVCTRSDETKRTPLLRLVGCTDHPEPAKSGHDQRNATFIIAFGDEIICLDNFDLDPEGNFALQVPIVMNEWPINVSIVTGKGLTWKSLSLRSPNTSPQSLSPAGNGDRCSPEVRRTVEKAESGVIVHVVFVDFRSGKERLCRKKLSGQPQRIRKRLRRDVAKAEQMNFVDEPGARDRPVADRIIPGVFKDDDDGKSVRYGPPALDKDGPPAYRRFKTAARLGFGSRGFESGESRRPRNNLIYPENSNELERREDPAWLERSVKKWSWANVGPMPRRGYEDGYEEETVPEKPSYGVFSDSDDEKRKAGQLDTPWAGEEHAEGMVRQDDPKRRWEKSGMSWIKRRRWQKSGMSWIKRDKEEPKENAKMTE